MDLNELTEALLALPDDQLAVVTAKLQQREATEQSSGGYNPAELAAEIEAGSRNIF